MVLMVFMMVELITGSIIIDIIWKSKLLKLVQFSNKHEKMKMA